MGAGQISNYRHFFPRLMTFGRVRLRRLVGYLLAGPNGAVRCPADMIFQEAVTSRQQASKIFL
jgi:hypothetical protein